MVLFKLNGSKSMSYGFKTEDGKKIHLDGGEEIYDSEKLRIKKQELELSEAILKIIDYQDRAEPEQPKKSKKIVKDDSKN